MGKYKEKPMYNVLSIRLTDEEKAAIDEISRYTSKSLSSLVRDAIHDYCLFRNSVTKTG